MLLLLKDFGRKKWMPLSVGKVANVHAIGMGRVVHQVEQTRMLQSGQGCNQFYYSDELGMGASGNVSAS